MIRSTWVSVEGSDQRRVHAGAQGRVHVVQGLCAVPFRDRGRGARDRIVYGYQAGIGGGGHVGRVHGADAPRTEEGKPNHPIMVPGPARPRERCQ